MDLQSSVTSRPVVFGIGAGVRDVDAVYTAAERFGAAVVGTAVACNAGRVPAQRLAGASGLRLPKGCTYVAFGVSGAPHHLAAADDVSLLVAVNTDALAPIRASADVLVVADATSVARALCDCVDDSAPRHRAPDDVRVDTVPDDAGSAVWTRTWELLLPRRPRRRCQVVEAAPGDAASQVRHVLVAPAQVRRRDR